MISLTYPVDAKYQLSQWFGDNKVSTAHFYSSLGLKGHNGLDFACPTGTSIYASHGGEIKVGQTAAGGVFCWVINKELGIKTFYCHLKQNLKKTGDKVLQGELIAISDNTGSYTTGAHLHFGVYEINKNGEVLNSDNGYGGAVDPVPYLATKYPDGTLIKASTDIMVFILKNGYKWWIHDEDAFKKYIGIPVNKAEIKIVDLFTLKDYPFGGIIGGNY